MHRDRQHRRRDSEDKRQDNALEQSRKRRRAGRGLRLCLLGLGLLLLIPLRDAGTSSPEQAYKQAMQLFLHGRLDTAQKESERNFRLFAELQPEWAEKFQLLEAEAMSRRGLNEEALRILSLRKVPDSDPEGKIHQLALKAMVLGDLARYADADVSLLNADQICAGRQYTACGNVLLAHGLLALEREQLSAAKRYLLRSLSESRLHSDRVSEVVSLSNLGVTALHQEHFDEALSWLRPAYQTAMELGDEDHAQTTLGNEGWAYFGLGDPDRALALFEQAGEKARSSGNSDAQLTWLITSGDVYSSKRLLAQAESSYHQALELGRRIKSEESIVDAAMDLAEVYVEAGKLAEADRYAREAFGLAQRNGNNLDKLYSHLIEGQIALERKDWNQAEALLREVESSAESQTSMRWASELGLAELYQAQAQADAAQKEYQTALATFEGARAELKNVDSQLPFVANATRIYDDYIHFLAEQGKIDEALMAADQSRARTLLQGLRIAARPGAEIDVRMSPQAIARKANATLLFYWLGERKSYLWVVTRAGTKIFPLASKAEIERRIERYRRALMGPEDPVAAANEDGRALYDALIGPAAEWIQPELAAKLPVMVLADGALCQLNFATLIAPPSQKIPQPHYWIEDATVISAPSLAMLAAGNKAEKAGKGGRLLLMGDAVSPDANYPQLAFAATEMAQVEKHFAATERTVYARESAIPHAYLTSDPGKFAFIHFVSHGVASQTDPLDSAIILSKGTPTKSATTSDSLAPNGNEEGEDGREKDVVEGSGADDSFKLYAREIMQHPINARLVTISACYGSGTRVYVGEGLVGLSWAFLHAGAHNAIGALWEASDRSTAMLMDRMYRGLAEGEDAAVALRNAQLELLHSKTSFHKPFYWAPFQLYTRM